MSGGHFDHSNYFMDEIADDIQLVVDNNTNGDKDSWGDTIGRFYDVGTIWKLQYVAHELRILSELVHHIDYLLSGDTGEDSFQERWELTMEEE